MNEEEIKKLAEEKENAIKEAEAAKAALAEKEAAIKAFQEKDLNFGNLRKQTAEEIRKAEEAKKAREDEVAILSKKVSDMEADITKSAEERRNKLVTAYAGTDEELKKQILFHFDRVKGEAKSDSEIESAIKDAYVLATGGRADQDVIRQVQGSGSSGSRTPVRPSADGTVKPEVLAAAEEFNKYGADIKPEDLKNPKFKVRADQSAESSYNL